VPLSNCTVTSSGIHRIFGSFAEMWPGHALKHVTASFKISWFQPFFVMEAKAPGGAEPGPCIVKAGQVDVPR
jgi:hypothetical protein